MKITIPYGSGHCQADIPQENLQGCYHTSLPPATDPVLLVQQALANPIGSKPLSELAVGKRNAVIIISDHTRPVPSKFLLPPMLEQLRQGNPMIDITLLVATGCHRPSSTEELKNKLGDEIFSREKIVMHDSRDSASLVKLGTLPSGGELIINRLVAETDLLLAEGFIEPHFFAGFSGGRKSVLPGVAAFQTVCANHCAEFINSDRARTGILSGNPIHQDMIFAAQKANLAFILNVVINSKKEIIQAFAGDCEAAHLKGCEFLRSHCQISVPMADIVVTGNGGYPLDQNIYQSVKGMTAGEAACRPGGVIILCARCQDGHGGTSFYQHLQDYTPEELLQQTAGIPREKTIPDQWQYQILARILQKYRVILVTDACDHTIIRNMHMEPATTLPEALKKAYAMTSTSAKVAVIPDGVSVIVHPEQ